MNTATGAPRESQFAEFERSGLPMGGLDALAAFVAEYVRAAASRSEVADFLGAMRRGWRLGPEVTGRIGLPRGAVGLHVGDQLAVQLVLASAGPPGDTIETLVSDSVIAVAGGGPLRLATYRVVRSESDRIPAIEYCSHVELAQGDSVAFRADEQTYVVLGADDETAIILATLVGGPSVSRRYDRTTLRYQQTIASALVDARLRFALQVICTVPGARSLEAAWAMLEHPSHHVRWAAIEALACLDGERAVKGLVRVLHDEQRDDRPALLRAW